MSDVVLDKVAPSQLPEVKAPVSGSKKTKTEEKASLKGTSQGGQVQEIKLPSEEEFKAESEETAKKDSTNEGESDGASMEEREEEPTGQSKEETERTIHGPLGVENRQVKALEPLRVLEAALFLANKPLSYKQMQDILQVPAIRIKQLLGQLSIQIPPESAVQLSITEHAASLQLKPRYLEKVAHLSKEVELSRKSMRILALVAKKKQMLQSELKNFFKGEIYAYVTELKEAGYIDSKKQGNTRLLKPSGKFFDSFQFKE